MQVSKEMLRVASIAVYAVTAKAIEPSLGIKLRTFDELPECERELHEDYARAALESALASREVTLVEPTLSDGEVNLLLGRDPYTPITPMQAMFREFYEKAVSSQQK